LAWLQPIPQQYKTLVQLFITLKKTNVLADS
jgi:hypothetical protein